MAGRYFWVSMSRPQKQRVDIQLKGSGHTSYSRSGDGRAVLGPMVREYIISEGMHSLGIPSTRSLAVTATGENVLRNLPLPGAILTRVAESHIRIGTFQYAAALGDKNNLCQLLKLYGGSALSRSTELSRSTIYIF